MESVKQAGDSRQAQIAQRLLRIRKEMAKLGKELKTAAPAEQAAQSEQAKEVSNGQHLKDFEVLQARLMGLYKTKGFEKLTNHLRHLQPLSNPERSKEESTMQELN